MPSLPQSRLRCASRRQRVRRTLLRSLPRLQPYREVTDESGRTVRIPQPVNRIVSLAPSLTETIYALGLQDHLVGDTDYCDYPPDAQKKTKVGGAINPSLEQIAALHPDLVLVTKSLNRLETVHALDGLGISATPPILIPSTELCLPRKNWPMYLAHPEAGVTVAADMQRRLSDLQQRLGALPPKRVLFNVWTQPLISVGKHTFIADALRLAGAVSIVDSDQDWPQVSLEEVAKLQPDFLVFAAAHSETTPADVEVLATLPGWRIVDAVSKRHYAVISEAVNRPAPRIVAAIEDLARQLHPEAFVEKPESNKEKIEKENPPPNQRPSAQQFFFPRYSAGPGDDFWRQRMRPLTLRRLFFQCFILVLILLVVVIVALKFGAVPVSLYALGRDLLAVIFGQRSEISTDYGLIMVDIRLPRILLGIFVGARFPSRAPVSRHCCAIRLPDPYVLGVSNGAAVGAFWRSSPHRFFRSARACRLITPLAAFLGATATIAGVYFLGRREGQLDSNTLLLAGIISALFFPPSSCF